MQEDQAPHEAQFPLITLTQVFGFAHAPLLHWTCGLLLGGLTVYPALHANPHLVPSKYEREFSPETTLSEGQSTLANDSV